MSIGSKRPRKSRAPAAMSVPRMRTVVTDMDAEAQSMPSPERVVTPARRKRRAKFVF
jgi:hypothetical protein